VATQGTPFNEQELSVKYIPKALRKIVRLNYIYQKSQLKIHLWKERIRHILQ